MLDKIDNEMKTFIAKIILPALIAISIKLAIAHKRNRVSLIMVVCSLITGIGAAYLSSDIVLHTVDVQFIPAVIALISITSEKVAYWLMYKFNIDGVLNDLVQVLLTRFKK